MFSRRTTIAYASYREDQWDVFTVGVDGATTTQLTDDPADQYAPRWSPDGASLLYMHGRLEGELPRDQVYVMSPQSPAQTVVSPPRLDGFSASWSPNGRKIVFIGKVGDPVNWEISSVPPDGSDLTRLTRSKAMEFDPSWAPQL